MKASSDTIRGNAEMLRSFSDRQEGARRVLSVMVADIIAANFAERDNKGDLAWVKTQSPPGG